VNRIVHGDLNRWTVRIGFVRNEIEPKIDCHEYSSLRKSSLLQPLRADATATEYDKLAAALEGWQSTSIIEVQKESGPVHPLLEDKRSEAEASEEERILSMYRAPEYPSYTEPKIDVFSFAIIMLEVHSKVEPFSTQPYLSWKASGDMFCLFLC
jgi:hypothetical protein